MIYKKSKQEREVDDFNATYPIGSEVVAIMPDSAVCLTTIREEASVLPGNITRCKVHAKDGYIRLMHISAAEPYKT